MTSEVPATTATGHRRRSTSSTGPSTSRTYPKASSGTRPLWCRPAAVDPTTWSAATTTAAATGQPALAARTHGGRHGSACPPGGVPNPPGAGCSPGGGPERADGG